jgi:hypothetical protein
VPGAWCFRGMKGGLQSSSSWFSGCSPVMGDGVGGAIILSVQRNGSGPSGAVSVLLNWQCGCPRNACLEMLLWCYNHSRVRVYVIPQSLVASLVPRSWRSFRLLKSVQSLKDWAHGSEILCEK